jgi:hypothetical protein
MNKKTLESRFKYRFIPMFVLLGITVIVACSFVVYWTFASDYFIANYRINQMRYWELPPQSEFLSFETQLFGGSSNFLEGRLTISSHETLEEIQAFYETNYGVNCLGDVMIVASSQAVVLDTPIRYTICNIIQIGGV